MNDKITPIQFGWGWPINVPQTIPETPVVAAFINEDDTIIKIVFEGGEERYLVTDGDCCSETWIEHVSNFDEIVGAKILSTKTKTLGEGIGTRQECDQLYSATLVVRPNWLDHLDVDIEFRNSSNGYYGGDIRWQLHLSNYVEQPTFRPLTEDF